MSTRGDESHYGHLASTGDHRPRPALTHAIAVCALDGEKRDPWLWRALFKDFEVIEVRGSHSSCIEEPRVGATADAVREAMKRER